MTYWIWIWFTYWYTDLMEWVKNVKKHHESIPSGLTGSPHFVLSCLHKIKVCRKMTNNNLMWIPPQLKELNLPLHFYHNLNDYTQNIIEPVPPDLMSRSLFGRSSITWELPGVRVRFEAEKIGDSGLSLLSSPSLLSVGAKQCDGLAIKTIHWFNV